MRLAARMQKKQWHILPADIFTGQLACELKISPLLAQTLINRGVKTADEAKSFTDFHSELLRKEFFDLPEDKSSSIVHSTIGRNSRELL